MKTLLVVIFRNIVKLVKIETIFGFRSGFFSHYLTTITEALLEFMLVHVDEFMNCNFATDTNERSKTKRVVSGTQCWQLR